MLFMSMRLLAHESSCCASNFGEKRVRHFSKSSGSIFCEELRFSVPILQALNPLLDAGLSMSFLM
jgi:hypothetical protein